MEVRKTTGSLNHVPVSSMYPLASNTIRSMSRTEQNSNISWFILELQNLLNNRYAVTNTVRAGVKYLSGIDAL